MNLNLLLNVVGLFLQLTEWFKPYLLVSLGAIFGSLLRLFFIRCFERIFHYKYLATFYINTIASFFLGLVYSSIYHPSLSISEDANYLFFAIGLLGSMSTFSGFIYTSLDTILTLNLKRFIVTSFLQVIIGVLSLCLGLHLGTYY